MHGNAGNGVRTCQELLSFGMRSEGLQWLKDKRSESLCTEVVASSVAIKLARGDKINNAPRAANSAAAGIFDRAAAGACDSYQVVTCSQTDACTCAYSETPESGNPPSCSAISKLPALPAAAPCRARTLSEHSAVPPWERMPWRREVTGLCRQYRALR